ncbi:hypothetical protein NQ317_002857 [Molorchus minor]|uniref:Uncharacterized protein n=1 Tax=Molorchus minor TaxID=1323400 RepID=A0ABQ9JXV7_9CUCU|nr:hypothetical protein NQ317_002857 [Molorchus minor]
MSRSSKTGHFSLDYTSKSTECYSTPLCCAVTITMAWHGETRTPAGPEFFCFLLPLRPQNPWPSLLVSCLPSTSSTTRSHFTSPRRVLERFLRVAIIY